MSRGITRDPIVVCLALALAATAVATPALAAVTEVSSVGVAPSAKPGGKNWNPSVSADGRYVAFESFAPNLVPDDANRACDVRLSTITAHPSLRTYPLAAASNVLHRPSGASMFA